MATLIPASQQTTTTGVEAYEDMFKEITRKLYGDESGHGLYPHNTQVAQLAQGTPSAPPEGGERSFTTLVSDRNLLEYDGGVITDAGAFKSEDHLSTAFNLAALMQNGFPANASSILNPVSFNVTTTKQQNANDDNRWTHTPQNSNNQSQLNQTQQQTVQHIIQQSQQIQNQQSLNQQNAVNQHQISAQISNIINSSSNNSGNSNNNNSSPQNNGTNTVVNGNNNSANQNSNTNNSNQQAQLHQTADEILPWNSNKISTHYINATQKLFKIKTKQEPLSTADIILNNIATNSLVNNNSITTTTNVLPTIIKNENNPIGTIQKRYSCSNCPYSTDRRDLFTRHENIHKEEKPFHCYACLKQFNRADHVKKHFLRMHREMAYDINKTRRYPSSKHSHNNNNLAIQNNNTNNIGSLTISTTASSNNNNSTNNNGLTTTTINTANFFTHQIQTPQLSTQNSQQNQSQNQSSQNQQTQTSTITIPFSQAQQLHSQSSTNQNENTQAQTIEQVVQNAVNQQNLVINANQQNLVIQAQQQSQPTVTNIIPISNIKHEKIKEEKPLKKKSEKRFMCCYCPWSGADNWGLKRHLNTHTKPFVCLLCDYKAARSERLATHVFKVHNKKACNKCSFFADDQNQLIAHQLENHQNDNRGSRTNNSLTNNLAHATTVVTSIANSLNASNLNVNLNENNSPVNNNSSNQNQQSTPSSSSNNLTNNSISVSNNTGNVLRTLSNTFVSNTQTLPSIHTSSSNVFGSLNSSLSNAATTIYTTNANANLVEQLNQHLASNNWRNATNTNQSNQNSNNHTSSNSTNNSNNLSNANLISNTNNINLITSINTTVARTPTTVVTSSNTPVNSKRKTGAERLFQYMEADDSDPELDYARQLQMQAMSRNTASVAQDFHNAGGVVSKKQNKIVVNSTNNNNNSTINNNTISNSNCSKTDSPSSTAIGNSMDYNTKNGKTKAMSVYPIESSPAASFTNEISMKRRRKSSSNDKENESDLLKKQIEFLKHQHQLFLNYLCINNINVVEKAKAEKEINDIFDKLYKNSISLYSTLKQTSQVNSTKLDETTNLTDKENCIKNCTDRANTNAAATALMNLDSLPEFLKNNKEITIIVEPKHNSKQTTNQKKSTNHNEDSNPSQMSQDQIDLSNRKDMEKRNRKQSMPRKIEKSALESTAISEANYNSIHTINMLRDKHLINLIMQKKKCHMCHSTRSKNSYHTKTSLLLHKMWRHNHNSFSLKCKICMETFSRPYKLALHRKIKMH